MKTLSPPVLCRARFHGLVRRAAGLALGLLAGGVGAGPAFGQTGGNTFTTTFVNQTVVTSTKAFERQDAFLSRLGSQFNGASGGELDLNRAFGDPAVQAALAQVRRELQARGAAPILGPLRGHSETLLSSATSQTNRATNFLVVNPATATIGPATILVGDNAATPFFVAAGNINIDVRTNNFITLNQLLTQTDRYLVTDSALLVGVRGDGFVAVDLGAVLSLALSGGPVAALQPAALLGVSQVAVRDVNGRLFRLRSGFFESPDGAAGPAGRDGKGGKEISPPPAERWRVYASGDYGFADQNDRGSSPGYGGDTWAATLGAEYQINPQVLVGLAGAYVDNRTHLARGLGHLDIAGAAVSAYGSYHTRHFYADALYSFGLYDDEIRRSTLLGPVARAQPRSANHVAELNLGYNFHAAALATGPYAALRYTHGELDGYTETGGGTAATTVARQRYDSLVTTAGWQASYRIPLGAGALTLQGRAAWERENLGGADGVTVGLKDSPILAINGGQVRRTGGLALSAAQQPPGDDYLLAGAGLRLDLTDRLSVQADYEGHFFRATISERFASLRAEVRF